LTETHFVHGLFVDESFVYWANDDGVVVKMPKAGGTLSALALSKNAPALIGVDDQYVYWFEQTLSNPSIVKVAK